MACDDRQLTDAQKAAAFNQQRTGVARTIRPFSGQATPENIVDYLNREVFPVLKGARDAVNEVFKQVVDNASSANPLQYKFSSETAAADPTNGFLRLDNATQNLSTTIRVSQLNARLVDATPWLEVMAGSSTAPLGVVTLQHASDPSRFIRFDLNSMTDQGAYWDLAVSVVESSGDNPFTENDSGITIGFIAGVASGGATVGPGSITPIADDTFLANISGGVASPTAVPLTTLAGDGIQGGANAVLNIDVSDLAGTGLEDDGSENLRIAAAAAGAGLTGGGGSALAVGAGTGITVNANDVQLATLIADSFFGNFTGIVAVGVAVSGSTVAGAGLTYTTGGILAVGAGTRITVNANDVQLASGAAETFLGNFTAGSAVADYRAGSSVAGAGLTYTAGGTLAVGAGTNVTVNANDVAVTNFPLTGLATQADDTFLANISGGAAAPTAVALTTLAGSGLTGGANAVLAVGAGDGIDVNADDVAVDVTDIVDNVSITEVATNNIQRAALTGFAAASAGSNSTTSAEPIVTYSSSANMSAERVTTSSTSVTVSTAVANQIEFQRAALTGAITASANSNTTAFGALAAQSILANATSGSAVPAALAIGTDSFPGRIGSGNLQSIPFGNDAHIYITSDDTLGFRKSRERDCWWEEFDTIPFAGSVSTSAGNFPFGFTNWGMVATGANGAIAVTSAVDNHPGIVRITTGATSTNRIEMYKGLATAIGADGVIGSDVAFLEAIVKFPGVTSTVWEFGLRDAAASNYIEFYGDTAVGTTIRAYTEEGGTATDTDTGTTFSSDTWYHLLMLQDTAGTIEFYVNGVLETTTSTNVPDAEEMSVFFAVQTRTSGTKSMDVDYVSFESKDMGNRF